MRSLVAPNQILEISALSQPAENRARTVRHSQGLLADSLLRKTCTLISAVDRFTSRPFW
jgi:hypothetical protein